MINIKSFLCCGEISSSCVKWNAREFSSSAERRAALDLFVRGNSSLSLTLDWGGKMLGKEGEKCSSVGSLLAARSTPEWPFFDGFLFLLAVHWWWGGADYYLSCCRMYMLVKNGYVRARHYYPLRLFILNIHTHTLLFIMEINKIPLGVCVQSRLARKNGLLGKKMSIWKYYYRDEHSRSLMCLHI